MAKYLFLIYGSEERWDNMSPQEGQRIDDGHRAVRGRAGTAIVASGALEHSSTATSLRAGTSVDHPTITDGPFLETKEAIGGFYLLEAPDLDAAIALARLLPEVSADHSGVEIRPLQGSS